MCGLSGFNFLAWEFFISVLWVWGLDSCQIPWWLRCHWSVLEMLQSWTIPWACRSFFPHSASAWNTSSSLFFLAVFVVLHIQCTPHSHRKSSFMPLSISTAGFGTPCLCFCRYLLSNSSSPYYSMSFLRVETVSSLHAPLPTEMTVMCQLFSNSLLSKHVYIPSPCLSQPQDAKLRSGGPTATAPALNAWTMVSAMKILGNASALLALWGGRVRKVREWTWWLNHS